jgi:hypothetical protein
MLTNETPSQLRTEAESARIARRLESLHNRPTCYEVVAELADGRKFLLGYRLRVGKGDLLQAPSKSGRGPELVKLSGIKDSDPFTYSREWGWRFGAVNPQTGRGKLRVYKGRTERTAILEGELEPVSNLPKLS